MYEYADANGCAYVDSLVLPEADQLVVDVRTAEPPCAGEGAGAVTLVPTGGVAPYGAIWEDFGVGLERDFIFAGEYAGSVYDARGCEIDFAVTLDEPSPLLVRHDMLPPTCYGDRDGVLEVMASGGQTPYVLRVDGGPWAEVLRADTLATGAHSFTLRDDAGCEVTQVVDVRPRSALPTEFEPRIIATREPVMAGDTLQLNVGSLAAGRYTSQWDYSRSAWMACDTCESTDFSPTAPGTVMVSLRDSLGCEARASVALEVPPTRERARRLWPREE